MRGKRLSLRAAQLPLGTKQRPLALRVHAAQKWQSAHKMGLCCPT